MTHQINLELICSLFESGGIEINIQVTVVLSTSRFLVCMADTLVKVKVKNLFPPKRRPTFQPTHWSLVNVIALQDASVLC